MCSRRQVHTSTRVGACARAFLCMGDRAPMRSSAAVRRRPWRRLLTSTLLRAPRPQMTWRADPGWLSSSKQCSRRRRHCHRRHRRSPPPQRRSLWTHSSSPRLPHRRQCSPESDTDSRVSQCAGTSPLRARKIHPYVFVWARDPPTPGPGLTGPQRDSAAMPYGFPKVKHEK
jgi:hypothetical protein